MSSPGELTSVVGWVLEREQFLVLHRDFCTWTFLPRTCLCVWVMGEVSLVCPQTVESQASVVRGSFLPACVCVWADLTWCRSGLGASVRFPFGSDDD